MDTNGGSTSGEDADTPAAVEPDADVRTFLIVDVRGYTSFTQAFGDEEAGRLAARFAALAREAVTAAGGEVIELRGDEALCVFRSARQALRAAVELQTRFRERLDGQPAFPLGIGVGLDAGEAVPIEGGYRGGALNLAARLCSIAAPGQILASETVTSLARTLEGVRFVDRRPVRLKGLEKPVRVIEIVPEAELPPVPEGHLPGTRGRRRGVLVMGTGALILAAAVVAAVFQLVRNGSGEPIEGPGVGVLDPKTGELLAAIPFGTAPSNIAVGEGGVWVLDADDRTVSRIDPKDRAVAPPFSTASTPTDLAAGAGAIWIGNSPREVSASFGGTIGADSVSRLDPESSDVVKTIPLPRTSGVLGVAGGTEHIAVTPEAVWVINPDLTVSRIDPRTNVLVARVEGVEAFNIAAGDGSVWIVEGGGVAKIDPKTNAVSTRIGVGAESLTALAVGAGAVWAADPEGGSIWRIDIAEGFVQQFPLEFGVGAVALGEGAVWATNELADKVYRIDPRTNRWRVVSRIPGPRGIAVGEGAVWVTYASPPAADAALPASACSKVFYGGEGSPNFLLVSDLPLQNPGGIASTRSMVKGIRFVLEQGDFKAGRYTVGYQSCDSSTAQTGASDLYRCSLNAKAFARNLDVVGVIGSLNSFCSSSQIPIANRAPDGPLAMISPSNTATGLTRFPQSEFKDQYPSGERNYVRIAAAEHLQAVARAELAKQLDLKSLFTLSPRGDTTWAEAAADVRKVARRLGLEIAGTDTWNPDARDFEGLAREIEGTGAEGVVITGTLGDAEGKLIRDLRAALGPRAPLIANDGFLAPPELIAAAGPAAKGMYISTYGLPNSKLPQRGQQFLAEFEAREGEPSPDLSAAYTAQATEILLEAIARSDGTRGAVTRELLETNIEDGILGDINFDENGDLMEGPVTIYRVVGKRDPNSLDGYQGAVFDRVITARAALLG
jgi:branched-chain amino acid transport system substrate-binding protein